MKSKTIFLLVLTALMLSISSCAKAQSYELTTATTYGAILNRDLQGDEYTGTIQVTNSFVLDKLKLSAVVMSYSTNNTTGFFSGGEIGYAVIPKVSIKARGLLGNTGKQLFGGGIEGDLGDIQVFGNAGYETKEIELWLEVGVGYKLVK